MTPRAIFSKCRPRMIVQGTDEAKRAAETLLGMAAQAIRESEAETWIDPLMFVSGQNRPLFRSGILPPLAD